MQTSRIKDRVALVPSFFTMANMFCGFYSVILSSNQRFMNAAWLIVAAAILDTLDGKMARLTKTASPFGVQYDSLADVVSFGLAPAVLLYYVYFVKWGTPGLLISFIPLVFGAIRLARFNIRLKGFDKAFFEGLPIPAAAITIATFIIFNYHFWGRLRFARVCVTLILLVSILMITNIRYETMPNFTLRSNLANRLKILSMSLGILILIFFPQEAFFPLAIVYVLSGVGRSLWLLIYHPIGPISEMNHEEKQ